jgi:hypothetical protein
MGTTISKRSKGKGMWKECEMYMKGMIRQIRKRMDISLSNRVKNGKYRAKG